MSSALGERLSVLGFYDTQKKILYFNFGKYLYFLARGAKTSFGVSRVLSYFYPKMLSSFFLEDIFCG